MTSELERNALFICAVLPKRVCPPMSNRYGESKHFGSHVDGAVRTLPGTVQRLQNDLSAPVFLPAPELYEGDEQEIERDLRTPSVKLAASEWPASFGFRV